MMSRGQFLHERELKRQAIKLADSLSHLEGADAKTVLQYAIDLVTWLDAIDARDRPGRALPCRKAGAVTWLDYLAGHRNPRRGRSVDGVGGRLGDLAAVSLRLRASCNLAPKQRPHGTATEAPTPTRHPGNGASSFFTQPEPTQ